MSEDPSKREENEAAAAPETETPEAKDWQWDAAAPMAGEDFLEFAAAPPAPEETAENVTEAPLPAAEPDAVTEESAEEGEATEETEKAAEPGCCIICGSKIRNSESDLYCNECRSKYMKVDFGASHIILSIIMVFVAVIGIVSFTATSKIVSAMRAGDKQAAAQQYADALDSYEQVQTTADTLNERLNAFLQGISTNFKEATLFQPGKRVQKKRAEILVRTMSIDYKSREALFDIVENDLSEKELNSADCKEIRECYDFCKRLDDTANGAYETWAPLLEEIADDAGEDGKIEGDYPKLKEIFAALDEYEKGHPDAEPSIMDYFRFNTYSYAQYYGVSVTSDQLLAPLKSAYDKAGKFGYIYASPCLAYLMEAEDYDGLLKLGKELKEKNPSDSTIYLYIVKANIAKKSFDGALKECEDLKKYNPDSLDYYTIKAEILRRKGDFSAAIDVCEQGMKNGADVELQRQEAIAYMLSGEEQKALKAATDAYETAYAAAYNQQNVSLEAINTSALIIYLCGDEDKFEEIKSWLKGSGYDYENTVYDVIKGKKTFEDLFMSGRGDV